MPENGEWNQLIEINGLIDAENGPLRKANDVHRIRLFQEMQVQAQGHPITAEMNAVAEKNHLKLMQYESQIAAFLLFHAEGQPGFDPNELKKLFSIRIEPPLIDILRSMPIRMLHTNR